jgi:Creatinine amidohydrolase
MLHVTGLFRADARIQSQGERIAAKHFSKAELASFGMDVHAGVGETSAILALRPELVHPSYKRLPTLIGRTREELLAIASVPGWQGYMSAPAKATAAYGRAIEAWWVDGLSDLILRAVGGENLLKAPRAPEGIDRAMSAALGKALANERAFELKLEGWLDRRRQK